MSDASILVFGGNSRLAAALRRHLPPDTRYVARADSGTDCVSVGDYRKTPASLLAGAKIVINCAGVARGEPALLREANVDTPLALARLARNAGVARFVHVSSFSILGRADRIDAATPLAPAGAYGRSKLAAEETILPLATDRFGVASVRLPAIIGEGGGDKLARLIRLWLRLRRLPVPRTPVQRSMISFDLAARVLADVAQGGDAGVLHAADSMPFTYERAAATIGSASGRGVSVLPLPDAALATLERMAPGLHDSLWTNSLLAPSLNRAVALRSDLYPTIADMAQREVAR